MTLPQCIFLELVSIIKILGTFSQSFRADERLAGGGRTCAALSYPSCPFRVRGSSPSSVAWPSFRCAMRTKLIVLHDYLTNSFTLWFKYRCQKCSGSTGIANEWFRGALVLLQNKTAKIKVLHRASKTLLFNDQ